jgi:hypothetical protein
VVTGEYRDPVDAFRWFVLTVELSDHFPYQKGRVTLYHVGDQYKRQVKPPISEEILQALVDGEKDLLGTALQSYVSAVVESERAKKESKKIL